jgi:ferric-dicitrate binding protein FerR (iron transport regulator)
MLLLFMKEAEELLEKYKAGLCTPEEVQLLQKWFHHLGEDEVSELTSDDLISARVQFEKNIRGLVLPERSYRLWPRIAVAAAAVAAVVVGVYFFNASRHANTPPRTEFGAGSQDIAPGKNGATITLANGKVIQLSDAKSGVVVGKDLKYNDGVAVQGGDPDPEGAAKQTISGSQLTASTAKGQTYQFTLPDGTKVWLNADSKISFPSQFSGKERKILLDGEGYFEVAKDKAHPFIVATDKQEVEVLGTHFNINAYKDESNTKTTLLEGSVRVYNLPEPGKDYETLADRMVILKPNQQSILTGSNRLQVKQVDVENIIAWQKGYFMFNNETLENIMKRVARWYDVEVIYKTDGPKDVTYYGTVSRFENISKVLSKLEATSNVKFKIEGNKIYISK